MTVWKKGFPPRHVTRGHLVKRQGQEAECFTVVIIEKQHMLRTGKPEQLHGLGAQGVHCCLGLA